MFKIRAALAAAALLCASSISDATPLAFTQTAVTCGTSSTTLLAAGSAAFFVRVHLPSNAANPVWINWSGAAATESQPSEDVQPGGTVPWVQFQPSQAISCVATAATSIVIEYR
jgi:hypothetical protein